LQRYFEEIDNLSEEDKNLAKGVLEAILVKSKIKDLTSLTEPEKVVIELYHDHGQNEQYHSELKSDMDVERLPSVKFQTNQLVLKLAMIAYNILRLIGQQSLQSGDTPLRREAGRRRICTVIQNLILIASRVVSHARKKILNFGRSNGWILPFIRIYKAFE
jgi:hypothetical protein